MVFNKVGLLFAALLSLCFPGEVFAKTSGGAPLCPYGTALPDGCPNAPAASALTVQDPNGFANSQQTAGVAYSRPPGLNWNIAGIDYPVGIKTYPDCSKYVCTGNLLKDPSNAANLAVDTNSKCTYRPGNHILLCLSYAAYALTLDGYDFSGVMLDIRSSGPQADSPIKIRNSYFHYTASSWNLWNPATPANQLVLIAGGGAVTLEYDYFDSNLPQWLSDATSSRGTIAVVVKITTKNLIATNTDCGAETSVCVQYSAFIKSPARNTAVDIGPDCTNAATPCSGQIFQYNYEGGVQYPYASFAGYIDDGTAAHRPGACLTITNMFYGNINVSAGANTLTGPNIPFNPVLAPQIAEEGCNTNGQPKSYNVTSLVSGVYAPQTMFLYNAVHGDPQFYRLITKMSSAPQYIGTLNHSFNYVLFPSDAYGATGAVTYMTSAGPIIHMGRIDDGTGTGTPGNVLTVTTFNPGSAPSSFIPGLTLQPGKGIAPGTIITGQLSGTPGGAGAYSIAGPSQLVTISTNTVTGAGNFSSVVISNNYFAINKTPTLWINGGSAGAIVNNWPVTTNKITITNNYFSPVGAWFCFAPNFLDAPIINISGNVNLTSLSDPLANTIGAMCANHFSHPQRRPQPRSGSRGLMR